jgi:hypothetical protein
MGQTDGGQSVVFTAARTASIGSVICALCRRDGGNNNSMHDSSVISLSGITCAALCAALLWTVHRPY